MAMRMAGADIIDIGGESTRPGHEEVSLEEEVKRVIPVTAALRAAFADDAVVLSIDTTKPEVARLAVEAGANMVNDISGGTYYGGEMLNVVAELGVPYCLMHLGGEEHKVSEIVDAVNSDLHECVDSAMDAGIFKWNICVDPGIGFGKTFDQNVELLRHVDTLGQNAMLPSLIGASRKRFLGHITGKANADERDNATHATTAAAISGGAFIVRVHDVEGAVDVARVSDAIWKH